MIPPTTPSSPVAREGFEMPGRSDGASISKLALVRAHSSHEFGQAIAHIAEAGAPRRALADLVEAYPGMLIYGGGTSMNPVRSQFQALASPPTRPAAERMARRIANLSGRVDRLFPDMFAPAREVLREDAAWMDAQLAETGDG